MDSVLFLCDALLFGHALEAHGVGHVHVEARRPVSRCTHHRMTRRVRIVDINAIRRRSPVPGLVPHDVICHTRTPP